MARVKNETGMANHLYNQTEKLRLLRVLRINYPLYRVKVEIEKTNYASTFHIIERYMDQLICGYTAAEDRLASFGNGLSAMNNAYSDQVYIRDKQTLFRLLGLDGDAREIAEIFYEDLRKNRHFIETKKGLVGCVRAARSLKEQKKYLSSQDLTYVLVDPFDARICKTGITRLKPMDPQEQTIHLQHNKNAYWCEDPPYDSQAAFIARLQEQKYTEEDAIDRDLPRGYSDIRVSEKKTGEDVMQHVYIPMYLAIFWDIQHSAQTYRLYRTEDAEPIDDIDLNDQNHRVLTEKALRMGADYDFGELFLPFSQKLIRIKNKGQLDPDFTKEPTGNYVFTPRLEMLEQLLKTAELKKIYPLLRQIAQGGVLALTGREMGRLVYLYTTEAVVKFCKNVIDTTQPPEEENEPQSDIIEAPDGE